MGWIANIFGGESGDGAGEHVPRERRLVERALQLCHGVESAARAVPDRHEAPAREAEDLAARLLERLQPVKDRLEAATPGTIASAQGVASPGGDGASPDEVPPIPEEEIERAAELLDRLHFDLIRLKVHGLEPGDVDLEDGLSELRGLLEDGMPDQLLGAAQG